MTIYRFQATSVDYWRGAPHRWQNTFHYSISNDAEAALCLPDFANKLKAMGAAASAGGLAEVAAYNTATGGVPVASTVFFPWQTTSSWISWPTGSWQTSGLAPTNGEAAARFRTRAGTGRTGKPIYVGIYWHAFLAGTADTGTGAQFSSSIVTAMSALYNALQTLSDGTSAVAVQVTPKGNSIAGTGTLLPYVEAHQRTRGRRRSIAQLKKELAAAQKVETVTGASGASGSLEAD
jgi:hypothetical protein